MKDNKIEKITDDKEYLYLMEKEEVIDYVLKHYDILDNVDLKNLKQIEQDYDKNIYVLMNDGNLFFDKTILISNIDRIYFLNAVCIYAITKDNSVISLTNPNSKLSKYIYNNGCRYKKIVTTPVLIACLTEEGNVRAISDETMVAFIPENFQYVADIAVMIDEETKLENAIVLHNNSNKWVQLYIS